MSEHDSIAFRESVHVVMQYLDGGASLKAALAACRAVPTDAPPEIDPESEANVFLPIESELVLGIDPDPLSREQQARYAALLEALDRSEAEGDVTP